MVVETARRIPTGLPLSDAELAALANLDEQALRDVLAWVALYGPEMLPFVLALPPEVDASDDGTAALALGITLGLIVTMRRQQRAAALVWNAPSLTYTTVRGTAIAPSVVRSVLDQALDRAAREVRDASQRLIRREIALAEWQRIMARQITMAEIAASAQARGGLAQLTAADYARSAQRITAQFSYLSRFSDQIARGQVPLDGRVVSRAALYMQANRGTYHEVQREMYTERGFTEERRVLGGAEHCDDCVRYAAQGWQPIGTLPNIGEESACRVNCRCSFMYSIPGGEEFDGWQQ